MSETDLILKNNYDVEFLLIETSHPGNIGACARAIKNMGFGKLGLVNPGNFPSDEAFYSCLLYTSDAADDACV